jgi:hypothetical protein
MQKNTVFGAAAGEERMKGRGWCEWVVIRESWARESLAEHETKEIGGCRKGEVREKELYPTPGDFL